MSHWGFAHYNTRCKHLSVTVAAYTEIRVGNTSLLQVKPALVPPPPPPRSSAIHSTPPQPKQASLDVDASDNVVWKDAHIPAMDRAMIALSTADNGKSPEAEVVGSRDDHVGSRDDAMTMGELNTTSTSPKGMLPCELE